MQVTKDGLVRMLDFCCHILGLKLACVAWPIDDKGVIVVMTNGLQFYITEQQLMDDRLASKYIYEQIEGSIKKC
jgi:hypothetical protein